MNEAQTGYRIRQHLNRGLDLDPRDLSRLRAARELALLRQGRNSGPSAFAKLLAALARAGSPSFLVPRVVLPVVLIVFGAVAIAHWQYSQRAAEIEDLDAAVLTDDLPIAAYLDEDFDAWLKRSSP